MYILGIDASSDWLNIALGDEDRVIDSFSSHVPRKHISLLHNAIDDIFVKSNLKISDIDIFAVVKGPGSFTGIRIAVTAVKGFVYALDKKVISLTSLEVLAASVKDSNSFIYPLIDARRGKVYSACYKKVNNKFIEIGLHELSEIDFFLKNLKYPAVLLGDGSRAYKDNIASLTNSKDVEILSENFMNIKPDFIVWKGFEKYKEKGGENIFDLKPLYIYPKECTIRDIQ